MTSDNCQLGFRIVGNCTGERRLVDWQAAFAGYCQCDERAEVNREAYLSAFTFSDEFGEHLRATRSTKGYAGRCGAPWLWFDIDAEGQLEHATTQARRLCAGVGERYGIDGDAMLIFFSGSKGFHAGLPMALMGAPLRAVEQEAKALAERRIALRESNGADATLNRQTLAFIVEGATQGDRHRLLFSAAANLAEFGCPAALAHALLSEPGLDSGLAPKEVRRQIDCGLEAKGASHGT